MRDLKTDTQSTNFSGASFDIQAIDTFSEPIERAFIGYMYYPSEIKQGYELKNLRDIYYDNFAPSELGDDFITDVLQVHGGINVFNSWDRRMRFNTDGRLDGYIPRAGEFGVDRDIKTMELVVYVAVPDKNDQVWFGSRYFPDAAAINGETIEVTANRTFIGRWEAPTDTTTFVHVWRTVLEDNPNTQRLSAEVRLNDPSNRGLLSFAVDESLTVDYERLAAADRSLDPNGRWDVWTNVVSGQTGLEESFRGEDNQTVEGRGETELPEEMSGVGTFLQELDRQREEGDPYEYDDWVFPITPKFIDASEREVVPERMFEYQDDPIPDLDWLNSSEFSLATGALGLVLSVGATALTAPAAGFVVGVLGAYHNLLQLGREMFARDVSLEQITGREEALNWFDKTTHDRVLNAWNLSDESPVETPEEGDFPTQESWVYTHRVPLQVDPDADAEFESSISGLWSRPGRAPPAGIEQPFSFRTYATPRTPGVVTDE